MEKLDIGQLQSFIMIMDPQGLDIDAVVVLRMFLKSWFICSQKKQRFLGLKLNFFLTNKLGTIYLLSKDIARHRGGGGLKNDKFSLISNEVMSLGIIH